MFGQRGVRGKGGEADGSAQSCGYSGNVHICVAGLVATSGLG